MPKIIRSNMAARCQNYAEQEQRVIWLTHRNGGCINIRCPSGEDHHIDLINRADIIAYCTPDGEWWCSPGWQIEPPQMLLF